MRSPWAALVLTVLASVASAGANLYVSLRTGYSFPFAPMAALLGAAILGRGADRTAPAYLGRVVAVAGGVSAGSYLPGGGNVPAFITLAMANGAAPARWLWIPFTILWAALGLAFAYLWRPLCREHEDRASTARAFPTAQATADVIAAASATAPGARLRPLAWGALLGLFAAALRGRSWLGLTLPARFPSSGALALDVSPLGLGLGSYLGVRVAGSMALGGVLMFGIAGPLLSSRGVVADESYGSVAAFAVWPAVGIVTGSALGAQLQAWRSAKANDAPGQRPLKHGRRRAAAASLGIALAAAIAMALAFPPAARVLPFVFAAAVTILIVAGVSVHAMATTDAVPVKALGPMAQVVAAVAAPGSLVVCAVLPHVACAAGLSAADTATSLRALDRTLPATVTPAVYGRAERTVLAHRFLGAAVGALTTMTLLPLVVPSATAFRPTESVPGPAVLLWSATTTLLSHGLSGLPATARGCLGAGLAVGLAWSFLEPRAAEKKRAWIPSMVALGGALVLPPSLSLTLLLGALLQAVAERRGQGGAAKLAGVGAVAGESLGTLLGLWLGR